MRVLRVRHKDNVFYGSLTDQGVFCLNKELGYKDPIPLQQLAVLPPVVPTKLVCVAVNYKTHAEEMGHKLPDEPVLFLKPPSAVIGSGQPIVLPPQSKQVDYEGELAVVIGKTCRNVSLDHVAEHIFGYACANDVTARDLQKKDGQFGRAKGFDSFAPIGPWIETEAPNPAALTLKTTVNGQVRQQGNTSDMLFPPLMLVSYISSIMTLHPGDTILTGTPKGVGPLAAGDEVRVEIETVGILINPVAAQHEAGETPAAVQ